MQMKRSWNEKKYSFCIELKDSSDKLTIKSFKPPTLRNLEAEEQNKRFVTATRGYLFIYFDYPGWGMLSH